MLYVSIDCFNRGITNYGIIAMLLQIVSWLITFVFLYFGVFNVLCPKIRGVNAMRTKNTFARKVVQIKSKEDEYIYMKVKFTLLPFFNWYTMKIPKKSDKVDWVRMPMSIDIHSEDINLIWNPNNHEYEVTCHTTKRIEDNVNDYRDKTTEVTKVISDNISDAIKGDSNMMKDYYSTSVLIERSKKKINMNDLKAPQSKLDKEVKA